MKIFNKNKKGFLALLTLPVLIVGLIALVIGVLALSSFFSYIRNNVLMLLGVFIIVVAFLYLLKNPKATKVFLFILLIGVVLLILQYSGLVRMTLVQDTTWGVLPIWGRLECGIIKYGEISNSFTIPTSGIDLWCKDWLTTECKYHFSQSTDTTWTRVVKYKICNEDGTGCGPMQELPETFKNPNVWTSAFISVKPGQKVWVYCEDSSFHINRVCLARAEYDKWGLNTFIEGAKYVKSGSCLITNDEKGRIPDGESYINPLKINQLDSEGQGYVNFITKWVFGPPTNVYIHPTYGEVYCEGFGNIYSIATLKTADTKTYKIRNREYYDASGIRYIIPSSPLPKQECCPGTTIGDLTCGDNFKLIQTPGVCSRDIDCGSGGQPYCEKAKTIAQQKCVSNKCITTTITVDCCRDSDCSGSLRCDLTDYKCKEQVPQTVCGNLICETGENKENCPKDCANEQPTCSWYQQLTPETTEKDWGLFSWRKIINSPKEVITKPYCKMADWIWIAILLLFILLIAILFMPKGSKKVKKK